jgi:hypothetical protein
MRRRITRGKQQILYGNLPGRTIDFGGGVISRIGHVRGIEVRDLNVSMLLSRIQEQASAWPDQFRPNLRDEVLLDPARFVVLDPKSVEAEFFPKVVLCDNTNCSRVFDIGRRRGRLQRLCPACRRGNLNQVRWIRVHRCGEMGPLTPPICRPCGTADQMALDTRGGERIAQFRWVCRSCNTPQNVFPGYCRACDWPGNNDLKRDSIEVHRGARTFYTHTTTLLNVPSARYAGLFALPDWKAFVGAKFLEIPGHAGRRLDEIRAVRNNREPDGGVSGVDLAQLLRRQAAGEISAEQLVRDGSLRGTV